MTQTKRFPRNFQRALTAGKLRRERLARGVSVRFDVNEYEFSHGRSPRGRGSWAFDFGAERFADGCETLFWTRGSTTYKEAKRLACEFARWLGEGTGEHHFVAKVCS